MPNPPYTHKPDGTPLPPYVPPTMTPGPGITYPDVSDEGEEIDCWNCEDKGWTASWGGIKMPCPDCKTGDLYLYHDRPA